MSLMDPLNADAVASVNGKTGAVVLTFADLGGSLAHSSLTGLTAGDDHTQYAFLNGRSGGQTLIGGTANANSLTLDANSQVWDTTDKTGIVNIRNSRMEFNGQTTTDDNTFNALISFNDTVTLGNDGTQTTTSLSGFSYTPTFQYAKQFNFGGAPAFQAAPLFQPTAGGFNDNALFPLSGFQSGVLHQLAHSGSAGTTGLIVDFIAGPQFARSSGTGTHTITDYAGFMSYHTRLFDQHIKTGYTVTTSRSFWAKNPDIGGGTLTNNIGLDVNALSGGGTLNVGVRIAPPTGTGAQAISVTGTPTTASGGILLGGDVNLYRSAANILTTDDELRTGTVGTNAASVVTVGGTQTLTNKTLTSPTVNGITNGTGLAAGTFTPTRAAEANLDANVTMSEAQYMRVGNTVTMSGRFTADPTLTATATSFEFTLPVASNFGAAEDAAGTAFCGTIAGQGAAITASAANDRAVVTWVSGDVTSQTWSYTFTYQVI